MFTQGATSFAERGKLPLKLTCPASTSTCPATLLNKGEIGLCPKHYLPSGASQGLFQLAPLQFFAEFTCNVQRGKWIRCTLSHIWCLWIFFFIHSGHMSALSWLVLNGVPATLQTVQGDTGIHRALLSLQESILAHRKNIVDKFKHIIALLGKALKVMAWA